MAIYSLTLGFISRSEGLSSVGFSAYIGGCSQKDERTGKNYSYTRKEDVVVSRVLAPVGSPSWMLNPNALWNHVEMFEDRIVGARFRETKDNPEKTQRSFAFRDRLLGSAVTAQTVMGALPLELNQQQVEACVEAFLKSRFVSKNLTVHYAILWDQGNPHFHALVSRRPLTNGAFSKRKDRDIVSRAEHQKTRKAWEIVVNKHLALAGFDVRIDCRSHKDRGSLFEAGFHEGYYAQRLAERGEYSRLVEKNEAIRQRNIQVLCSHPEALIHEVSGKRTVFTRQHLEEEIIRRVGGDAKLFALLRDKVMGAENPSSYAPSENFSEDVKNVAETLVDTLLSNPDLAKPVGQNLQNENIFTSSTLKEREEKILEHADALHQRTSKTISPERLENACQSFPFSDEQKEAIAHLCSGPDIRILNGRAGAGKTTLLKTVAALYQGSGYTVIGTSFQGKAVEVMEREIGVSCKTLDSLLFQWQRYDQQKQMVESGALWGKPYLYAFQKMKSLEPHLFTDRHVIVVDEANMISNRLWEPFLEEASSKGAKVLLIQDTAQIKSREPGDTGRLLAERFGAAETTQVMRQKEDWQKEASRWLNEGNVLDGLTPYHNKGNIHWQEGRFSCHDALIQAYLKDLKENPQNARIMLAYRNRDVAALNQIARSHLKQQGMLGPSFTIQGQEFALQERIRFTQNDHQGRYVKNTYGSLFESIKERLAPTQSQGIQNGTLGTITGYKGHRVSVKLDDGRSVAFNALDYPHITHGYALSIHKSEGSTFDRAFVKIDPLMDPSTLLVAMTRHRLDVQAFVDANEIIDFKALVQKVGRGAFKDTLQDYQVLETQKPYLQRVQSYMNLMKQTSVLRDQMDGPFKEEVFKSYAKLSEEKKFCAHDILSDWGSHLPFTRMAGLRKDVLEVQAGLKQRTLSDLEHRAQIQVEGYRDVSSKTRELWTEITQTHPPVLTKSHPRYAEYADLRDERDSLAYLFQETPRLYRPFLKGISHRALNAQAQSHQRCQQEKSFADRLNATERPLYDTTKAYADSCRMAASLYHLLKQGHTAAFTREEIQHHLKNTQAKRDELAFELISTPSNSFLPKFKIQESKLLEHAMVGELRAKVAAYKPEDAHALQELLSKIPSHQSGSILKEQGLSPLRLRFDGLYKGRDNPDFVFHHIRDYRDACQNIARALKQKQPLGALYEERKQAAQRLMNHSNAYSAFKTLFPENKLEMHAGKARDNTKPHLHADHVMGSLKGRFEGLARDLLGEPNHFMSSPEFLRFGTHGKIVVNTKGSLEGLWYDFSKGVGGNIFQLIQQEKGLSFKEALIYAAQFTGHAHVTIKPQPIILKESSKREGVLELLKASQPIENTGAEIYLRHRGIHCVLPQGLRFIPKNTSFTYQNTLKTLSHDCLADFGRNGAGEIQSVQITKLNPDGTRDVFGGEKLPKLQYGQAKGSCVTIQHNPDNTRTFVVEGIETALSLKMVGLQGYIIAAQGIHNIKNLNPTTKDIILAADNDGGKTDTILESIQSYFTSKGHTLTTLMPKTPGHDFNDVLQNSHKHAVKQYFRAYTYDHAQILKTPEYQKLKESLKSDHLLKSLAKDLHHNPNLLDTLKIEHPELGKRVESMMPLSKTRIL